MADPSEAFEFLMDLEGGGETHTVEGDPGGTTKWGFSQRSYPRIDIPNLDREGAVELFRKDFWRPIRGEQIESQEIATEIAEMHFHTTAPGNVCGPAVRAAQAAANDVIRRVSGEETLNEDGCMGPKTLAALNRVHELGPVAVLAWAGRFNLYQLRHYRSLRPELVDRFFVGWTRRVVA